MNNNTPIMVIIIFSLISAITGARITLYSSVETSFLTYKYSMLDKASIASIAGLICAKTNATPKKPKIFRIFSYFSDSGNSLYAFKS